MLQLEAAKDKVEKKYYEELALKEEECKEPIVRAELELSATAISQKNKKKRKGKAKPSPMMGHL